jgi:PqqA peptide cyclase
MSGVGVSTVPGLRPGARLIYDQVRGQHAVLLPEGVLLLNDTAAEVVRRWDGRRDVAAVAADLAHTYDGVTAESVVGLVEDLVERRVLTADGTGRPVHVPAAGGDPTEPREPVPVGLLAELTYRCPLHCTYCSNPVNLSEYAEELTTSEWCRVLGEARRLGVLQLHLSGGEPLLRRDLRQLVAHASRLGLYTNLVTSGIPLRDDTLESLVDAGLDHLQLSIQDSDRAAGDAVAGIRAYDRKLAAARAIRRAGLPLTVNVVLHAGNIDRLGAIAELAVHMGASRLELANTQYYGWGLRNRGSLMPTPAQVEAAATAAADIHQRFGHDLEIVYVNPDYHAGRPKPCMNGWGSRQLVVAPNGDVLPCLAAGQLPGLELSNVRRDSLSAIWYDSSSFNRFRGTDWMPEPCHSCALRDVDFGGCRCQAYQLVGDPAATDPVCDLSPHHHLVAEVLAQQPVAAAVPRRWSLSESATASALRRLA